MNVQFKRCIYTVCGEANLLRFQDLSATGDIPGRYSEPPRQKCDVIPTLPANFFKTSAQHSQMTFLPCQWQGQSMAMSTTGSLVIMDVHCPESIVPSWLWRPPNLSCSNAMRSDFPLGQQFGPWQRITKNYISLRGHQRINSPDISFSSCWITKLAYYLKKKGLNKIQKNLPICVFSAGGTVVMVSWHVLVKNEADSCRSSGNRLPESLLTLWRWSTFHQSINHCNGFLCEKDII